MGKMFKVDTKDMFSKKNIKSYIIMTLGLLLLSLGVHFFQEPNELALGGVTGIAMVMNKVLPIFSMGTYVLIFNVILLIIGFIFIGSSFGVKTIYCSIVYSLILMLLEKMFPISGPFTDDLFIELLIGMVISAVGMAIVFNENGSTGGTDIIAKILNKYVHLDIGKSLLVADFGISISAFFAFGTLKGMYAIVGVVLNGVIIDDFTAGISVCKRVEIITNNEDEVLDFIMNKLSRGATVYSAHGAYTNEPKRVVSSVIPKKEFIRLKLYLKEVDPKCFIIAYDVHETIGEGFKNLVEY